MMYSFEKTYNPWDTEPDFFDFVIAEEEELINAKANNEVSLDSLADEEINLDESEFDL